MGNTPNYLPSTSHFLPRRVLSQTCEEGASASHSMIVMPMELIFIKHWSCVWCCAPFYTYHPSCLIFCVPEHCCHTESNTQFFCVGFPPLLLYTIAVAGLHLPSFAATPCSIPTYPPRGWLCALPLLFKCPGHLPLPLSLTCTTPTPNFSLNFLLLFISSEESSPTSQPILVPLLDSSYLLCLAFL